MHMCFFLRAQITPSTLNARGLGITIDGQETINYWIFPSTRALCQFQTHNIGSEVDTTEVLKYSLVNQTTFNYRPTLLQYELHSTLYFKENNEQERNRHSLYPLC